MSWEQCKTYWVLEGECFEVFVGLFCKCLCEWLLSILKCFEVFGVS
jgi:hypothetical protein